MAYVRRHWLSSACYVLVIFMGMAVWLVPAVVNDHTSGVALARVPADEPDVVDPHVYTQAQVLRRALMLTNSDLAAMGCTADQMESVLVTLKSWCTTHREELEDHHRSVLRVRSELRQALRRRTRNATEPTLVSLQDGLAHAQKARRETVASLITELESLLTTGQRELWQSARDNAGLPQNVRYAPGATAAQRATPTVTAEDGLSWSQRQVLAQVRANRSRHMAAVLAVEAAVLPNPVEYAQSARSVVND